MKHYFVVNPVSGKNIQFDVVNDYIIPAAEKTGIDYEIYMTKEAGDGTRFVKDKVEEANGEPVRFYAVGGDGTLYEVCNGAVGYPNAEISVVPKGSGNDWLRLFGTQETFLQVEDLINGKVVVVDGLKITHEHGTQYA
ncbi:MAG TPA: acylglycerol kinase family protein, partial [Clostridiales bacterium]|nr:acylglycerol kinase family protein [Clostridiales bacterium]